MADFWDTTHVKAARKEHNCIFCGKTIVVGESYYNEKGHADGRFQHYALCERCRFVATHYDSADEYLSDFDTELNEQDWLVCPKCKQYPIEYDMADDLQSCRCECNCDNEYTVDLSLEGIKAIIARQELYAQEQRSRNEKKRSGVF